MIKLCFQNEIHKVYQIPSTFFGLVEKVQSVLKEYAPPQILLEYDDLDGDRVMISCEEDYKTFLESTLSQTKRSIKIHILESRNSVINKPTKKLKKQPNHYHYEPQNSSQTTSDDSQREEGLETNPIEMPRIQLFTQVKNPIKDKTPHLPRKEIKQLVRDVISHAIPGIAEKVQLINSQTLCDSTFKLLEKSIQANSMLQSQELIIHDNTVCSECKTTPLIGIRYKCYECESYELCQNCEKINTTHNHPFIKIKSKNFIPKISQSQLILPMKNVSEVLREKPNIELADKVVQTNQSLSQLISQYLNRLYDMTIRVAPKQEQIRPESNVNIICQSVSEIKNPPDLKKLLENIPQYDYQFIQEISTIPSNPTTSDDMISITVTLKNKGRERWPNKTFIIPTVPSSIGNPVRIVSIEPSNEISVILTMKGPFVSGQHKTEWRVAYEVEGKIFYIGKPLYLSVNVAESKPPIPEKPIQKIALEGFSKETIEKFQALRDIFQDNLEKLIEVLKAKPEMSIGEIADHLFEILSNQY